MALQWFHALARYEFAMRVDDDICLLNIAASPFDWMREHRLVYGYGLETVERHEETLETMPTWLQEYVAVEGLQLPAEPAKRIFFTNFFVSRVDWWFGDEVQRFLLALDHSGGIFSHRWGDAPIQAPSTCALLSLHPSEIVRTPSPSAPSLASQTTALQLFAPPNAVARIETDYLHASTMNRIFADGHETDGWNDLEMWRHPLVRAYHHRILSEGNMSNMSNMTLNVAQMPPPQPPTLPPPPSPPTAPPFPPLVPGELLAVTREQLATAFSSSDTQAILVPSFTTIDLGGSPLLVAGRNLTVRGQAGAVLNGGGLSQLFDVSAGGKLTLEGLTLTGGSGSSGGALIISAGGAAELIRCNISDSQATEGGGLLVTGANSLASIVDCFVFRCSATSMGGGILAALGGFVRISASTVRECAAFLGGGIAAANGGLATISDSFVA
eukprot:7332662-Prymnesium_polylepis.1